MTERTPEAPEPTVDTRAYWAAAAEHRLTIGACLSCGKSHFYPRTRCPYCLSGDTQLKTAEGSGTVYSFSVMRRAKTPYAIAYVRLDEGVTMMTNIVECAFDKIRIGMPVRVTFRPTDGGPPVPMFRPA